MADKLTIETACRITGIKLDRHKNNDSVVFEAASKAVSEELNDIAEALYARFGLGVAIILDATDPSDGAGYGILFEMEPEQAQERFEDFSFRTHKTDSETAAFALKNWKRDFKEAYGVTWDDAQAVVAERKEKTKKRNKKFKPEIDKEPR